MLLTSPDTLGHDDYFVRRIFLAGSIENGKAIDWQADLYEKVMKGLTKNNREDLFNESVVFFNPRRKEWNPSASEKELKTQINWELKHLTESNIVFFFFAKGTISPISLLELGLMIRTNKKIIVVCEDDYFRATNVSETLSFFSNQFVFSTLEDGIDALIKEISLDL
jgi:hypothetical protein